MMKKVLALAVLACVSAFATLQFEVVDINYVAGQNWEPANQYKIHVTGSGSLWIRNEFDNQFSPAIDLGVDLKMKEGSYGIIDANGNLTSVPFITKDFSYENVQGKDITTTGYFMGDFEGEADIYFWVTSNASGIVGEEHVAKSIGPVTEEIGLELGSRQVGPQIDFFTKKELVNFGFGYGENTIGVAFVFDVAEKQNIGGNGGTSGAPLPGVWATLALVGGLMGAKKMKKSKK